MCGVSLLLLEMVDLIRLRGALGGEWNDRSCLARTRYVVCTPLEDSSLDVFLASTMGISFVMLIVFSLLFRKERKRIKKLRSFEKWEYNYI